MKQNTLLAVNAILFLIIIVLFGFNKFSGNRDSSVAVSVEASTQAVAGTIANDGFNRTSLGANWQIISGKPVIVTSTDLGTSVTPANAVVLWKPNTFTNDQFSLATLSTTHSANVLAKVFVRRRATDNAHYSLSWNSKAIPAQWEIKYDGVGTNNRLLASTPAPTIIAGGIIRIEAIGTTINGYFNGTLILTTQDATLSSGGTGLGFVQKSGSSVKFPTKVFTSWQGGDIGTNQIPPSAPIPLTDMTSAQNYNGFSGGLYENTTNTVPVDHGGFGLNTAGEVVPLDVNGIPDPTGKVILMSIGMSNTTQEWCAKTYVITTPCDNWTFTGQALSDSRVNTSNLVILDGAAGGQDAVTWDASTDTNYDRVATSILSPLGYSEKQVQVVWLKEANAQVSGTTLPSTSADAYTLETNLGNIIRAAKVRYPNLKQVFLSSRIYAGYNTVSTNPEPYAYESGFSVKWLIQAQIDQMRNGGVVQDTRAGDLNYSNGIAPWIAWGPYLWANGTTPRSDGLTWVTTDYDPIDMTHPSQPGAPSDNQSGEYKVGNMLLNFFINSAYSSWFR